MPNIFDQLKATVFKEVTSVMGFEARWLSSTTDTPVTALHGVTFKYPSLKEKQFTEFDDTFWEPTNKVIEYFESDWPGLYDSINSPVVDEVHRIHLIPRNPTPDEVLGTYYIAGSARRAFDGDTVYIQVFPDPQVEI